MKLLSWFKTIPAALLILLFVFLVSFFPNSALAQNVPASEFVPDELFVKFQDNVSEADRDEIALDRLNALERRKVGSAGWEVIKVTTDTLDESIAVLEDSPQVEGVSKKYYLYAFEVPDPVTTDDPKVGDQWYLKKIEADRGWNINRGSANVRVAVLDSGVNTGHEDLKTAVVGSSNFTIEYAQDFRGHGTAVAGIISAAVNNEKGIAGVGHNTSILTSKILYEQGTYADPENLIKGIKWAVDRQAKVINLSLGTDVHMEAIEKEINWAWSKGVVIVGAAGNSNNNNLRYPAAYEKVLSVAGTDHNDNRFESSNFGSWVDVAAPGKDILTTCIDPINVYCYVNGTSYAAPQVSALAAMLFAQNPNWTNQQVRDRIEQTAEKIPGTGQDWVHGRINVNTALSSNILKISAAGTGDNTGYPELHLKIDDKLVKTVPHIKGDPNVFPFPEYNFGLSSSIQPSQVKVEYVNDVPLITRDLYVEKINIDGEEFRSDGKDVYTTGFWDGSKCKDGKRETIVLGCNGYFQYDYKSYGSFLLLPPDPQPDFIPPNPPTNLRGTIGLDAGEYQADLLWDQSPTQEGVTKYLVYKDFVGLSETTSISITDKPLVQDTEYVFFVVAIDAAGNKSDPSNIVILKTPAVPADSEAPVAPVLSAEVISKNQVKLDWTRSTDNVGLKEYELYRDGVLRTVTKLETYTDNEDFAENMEYTYYVVAKDLTGNKSESNTVKVTPNKSLGGIFNLPLQSTPSAQTFMANDPVLTAAVSPDGTIYIGGHFTQVGAYTGNGVPVDKVTGQRAANFPKTDKQVNVVIPDGSGGWYIGGKFTKVGGVDRKHLAHINADGSIDPSLNVNPNLEVLSLALQGNILYVGGLFSEISPGNTSSRLITAIDVTTGQIKDGWNGSITTGSSVSAIATSPDGNQIFIGGNIQVVGGQDHYRFASLNAADGSVVANWNTNINTNGTVTALKIVNNLLFAGGTFTTIGGQVRNGFAEISLADGSVTAWNPLTNGRVNSFVSIDNTLYVGGAFTSILGQSRTRLAAIDTATKTLNSWNPAGPDNAISAMATDGNLIYIGGTNFFNVGGQARQRAAAVKVSDGTLDSWNPKVMGTNSGTIVGVMSLATSGSQIFMAGSFVGLNASTQRALAAIDGTTGEVKPWNFNADFSIQSILVDGATLYIGGSFRNVNGQARNNIAAVSSADGSLLPWYPTIGGFVNKILKYGNNIYVGGSFIQVEGVSGRKYLARFNETSGAYDPSWNLNLDGNILDMELDGEVLYVGGSFQNIGGLPIKHLAAIDLNSGNVLGNWAPNPDDVVWAIKTDVLNVYTGGEFLNIGGQARKYAAKLNKAVGNESVVVDPIWNPNPNECCVNSLATRGSNIYLGGSFSAVGGTARNLLVEVTDTDGEATDWNIGLSGGVVETLLASPAYLYAGGDFNSLNSGGGVVNMTNFTRFNTIE